MDEEMESVDNATVGFKYPEGLVSDGTEREELDEGEWTEVSQGGCWVGRKRRVVYGLLEVSSDNGTQSFKARGQSLTLATPPATLSSRLMHNIQNGSVDFDTTDMEQRVGEQDINEGIHGDTYRKIYGNGYRDANVDMYDNNPVSGGPSRAQRRAFNLSFSDKQGNVTEDEAKEESIRKSSSSGTQPQKKPQERIKTSHNMQQARGQRTQRSIDVGNSDHETGSQKKLQNRNTASRNVIITAQQAGLQEQELKPHAAPSVQQKAQNAFAQNVLKPGVTTFDTHIIDGQQRVIEKEIDVETNGETDVEDFCSGDTLQKKRVEQSNDPLKIINK
ncbi:110bdf05-1576-40b3-a0ae-63db84082b98 [Sclerotinia trifoliorum]|uniref:110bdf05-1576-40b3-a0ae-63db84082b98 n=1 Tax=Sclerotinia trifoliorum TaxID=28548 RepID=A0A8H2ZMM2_9HELO|nr:110bdf05-1576-40b3-a0ae-63db84082b98 [Sclerotinia trifoliorum]